MLTEFYKVKQGQNIFDVALQIYGSASCALDLARMNGITLDTPLTNGLELVYVPLEDRKLTDHFKIGGTDIATSEYDSLVVPELVYKPFSLETGPEAAAEPETAQNKEIGHSYRVKGGQNIFDVAAQLYGGIENALSLLIGNGLNLDSNLVPGTSLTYEPDPEYISEHFKANGVDLVTSEYLIEKGFSPITERAFSDGFHEGYE